MFPISLLTGMPAWKLAAAGAVAVLLAGTHWKTYTMGRNGEQAKAAVLKAQQTEQLATFNENQRLIERGFTAKATKAQNDRAIKSGSAQPLLRSVSAELDGLRSDVYRLDTDASGQPASACKTAAITGSPA